MFDLSGKVALVTGSARGLGAGIAKCLAEAGADVAVNYTAESSKERAEAVVNEIRAMGRDSVAIRADVSNEDDVRAMFETLDGHFGRLDILCNNAGTNSNLDIYGISYEEWNRVMSTNIGGGFLCSKYAVPLMQRHHFGRIIMTSSVVAHQGTLFGQVHYGASKGAQISFARTLARTVACDGITVNTVAPGTHMTEQLQNILINGNPERIQKTIEMIPMHKLGTPEDIGYTCVFLASDEAQYITGANIDVNGGLFMG